MVESYAPSAVPTGVSGNGAWQVGRRERPAYISWVPNCTSASTYAPPLTATSVDLAGDAITLLANQGVEIHDVPAVAGYLRRYPDVVPIVPDIVTGMRKTFSHTARLFLKVHSDPEIDRSYLTLLIRLPEYPVDTLDRIDAAFMAFGGRLSHTAGWIVPDTDFVRA